MESFLLKGYLETVLTSKKISMWNGVPGVTHAVDAAYSTG